VHIHGNLLTARSGAVEIELKSGDLVQGAVPLIASDGGALTLTGIDPGVLMGIDPP
jgi:hypothetical protein